MKPLCIDYRPCGSLLDTGDLRPSFAMLGEGVTGPVGEAVETAAQVDRSSGRQCDFEVIRRHRDVPVPVAVDVLHMVKAMLAEGPSLHDDPARLMTVQVHQVECDTVPTEPVYQRGHVFRKTGTGPFRVEVPHCGPE